MELTHILRYLITKQFIWHIRLRVFVFVSIEVLRTYCWKASKAIKNKKDNKKTHNCFICSWNLIKTFPLQRLLHSTLCLRLYTCPYIQQSSLDLKVCLQSLSFVTLHCPMSPINKTLKWQKTIYKRVNERQTSILFPVWYST